MTNGFNIEALLDALADRVAERLTRRLAQSDNGGTARPRLLSIEQAAIYLGRTKEAVQHMVSSRKIPKVQGDRRIQIDIRDLDRWIEANKQAGSELSANRA